jgi:hypothetical protein
MREAGLSALNDASPRKALGALKPPAETLPLYRIGVTQNNQNLRKIPDIAQPPR